MKTDVQIREDVLDELMWEPMLKPAEIGVAVTDGIVTLSGYVNDYSKKLAAEKAVKRVKGVKAVAEDIQVRLPFEMQKDDEEIAGKVVNALKWNTNIPDEKISVKVDNGWVTLDGELEWQFQRDAALTAVRDLVGINGVINLLKLKPVLSTSIIKSNIRKALERNADLEADKITIDTSDSTVTINGKVHSWSEKSEAERAIWATPGVAKVINHLEING
ncbi:BON domain-containing protein [Chitinophaga sp.]|uniref:BON domain-containing protein n=1 Tax=Chitinophaga sp. TaxID=1869181 RepID=UPI002CAF7BAC|nr:BON domain-containing protein [Chitinophaga sp.]HWV66419.1 BON domain-containing protein [Chitinophaga sp.]